MTTKKGLFIVFEGIDGSGKGTQLIELIKSASSLNKYIDTSRFASCANSLL